MDARSDCSGEESQTYKTENTRNCAGGTIDVGTAHEGSVIFVIDRIISFLRVSAVPT
jgi:hypothetical protein